MEKWIFKKAIVKLFKRGIQIFLAWIGAQHLENFGIRIDEAQATIALWAVIEFVRDFIKRKLNLSWL